MTLRDAGVEREIELALTALLSPVAQQFSELRNCGSRLGCHCDFPLVSKFPLLSSPGELLELIFQRRIGDSSSIVRNRRGRDYGDNLQDLLPGETGGEKCIELLATQVPPLLDERLCQGGKRGKSPVPWHQPRTDRAGLFRTHSGFESKCGGECHSIRTGVRDCVCQQNDLN